MKAWVKRDLKVAEIVLICVILVVIAARLALPHFLKVEINQRLDRISGYSGHVDDVGAHVWHGGYSMHGLVIQKRGAPANEPFIAAQDITFTIAYRDLLHGRLTSDVIITEGQINFEQSANPAANQNLGFTPSGAHGPPAPARPWQDVVRDLFPLKITHLELIDSRIHYIDDTAQPRIDLAIDNLNLTANGLRNRPSRHGDPMPATITANGTTIGRGRIHLVVRAEPLAAEPHFQLHLALENVDLTSLNPFLLAHAGVDVGRGTLQVYSEMAAQNGAYEGYVKPILTDLDFHTRSDAEDRPLKLIWKDIVAAATRFLRDKEHKQVATIVPFSGNFAKTSSVNVGDTLRNLFYNGFIQALHRGLETNILASAGP